MIDSKIKVISGQQRGNRTARNYFLPSNEDDLSSPSKRVHQTKLSEIIGSNALQLTSDANLEYGAEAACKVKEAKKPYESKAKKLRLEGIHQS